MSTSITKVDTSPHARQICPSNFGISITITFASRLSTDIIITSHMWTSILKEIWSFLVPEIRPFGFGILVPDIAKKHLLGMKDGLEGFQLRKMVKPLSVVLTIKVLSFGISIKKHQFWDSLHMIMSFRLCYWYKARLVPNWWTLSSWSINLLLRFAWMLSKN